MSSPGKKTVPVIQYLVRAYKLWHEFLPHVPKSARYTLGGKIDAMLIETLEAIFTASVLPKEKKLPYLVRAAAKLDLAKFFLQICWEIKAVDNKKYAVLSEQFDGIGR